MNINERLERVRLSLGFKKREFSDMLGIHANTYTNYINGLREIPTEIIKKLSTEFGISFEWLLNGSGGMQKLISVVHEPSSEYKSSTSKFRNLTLIPAATGITSFNEWISLSIDNLYPDSQFVLRIDKSSDYIQIPFIKENDLLLCSTDAIISNGDIVAARWSTKSSGIRICNYSSGNRDSFILTSLNNTSPPVFLRSDNADLYKVLMIIKG